MRISLRVLRRIVEQELLEHCGRCEDPPHDQVGEFWEGVSANGAEGLGGHGEGFEQQNQGVTRRQPGEGAKVNGGRPQSQEMEDYGDQPQYLAKPEGLACVGENEMPWGGMQDPAGWDRQIALGNTGDGTDQTDEER